MSIGSGERAWVESFDEHNVLASKFRGAEYTPQKDGSFKVTRPEWVFFLSNDEQLSVTGETGNVFVGSGKPGSQGSSDSLTPAAQMPNHGVLHDVRIELAPKNASNTPSLWLKVNNIAFDNDTMRLYTQSYQDAAGNSIAADRVPVTVRGDDYEFDGTGLTLHWNDRDRRLHLLEIAHGGRMQIKHPTKLSTPWSAKSAATASGTIDSSHDGFGAALRDALVSIDPAEAGRVIAGTADATTAENVTRASSTTTTAPANEPYRAVFHDDVRVLQCERQIATANTMTVDFLQAKSKTSGNQVAVPGGASGLPADQVATANAITTAPSSSDQSGMNPSPDAKKISSADVTGDANSNTTSNLPITIYWTGKLRVTTLETEPVMPLIAGQAAVRLVGSPAVLTPEKARVEAAAVMYRSGDGAVQLENSDQLPKVQLDQEHGAKFSTESFAYDPATSLATMQGDSELTAPVQGKQMKTTWTKRGVLHFLGKSSEAQSIDRAELYGDVNVNHPQFTEKSDDLTLDLEKAAATANAAPDDGQDKATLAVKRVIANGNVRCELLHQANGNRGINGDRLVMEMSPGPDGKLSPHEVIVDGNVRAYDAEQKMESGHLTATLRAKAPAPMDAEAADATAAIGDPVASNSGDAADAVELESMHAWSNVHAVLKTGAVANADDLQVTTKDGQQQVELRGNARVEDGKKSSVSGPLIHIIPDAQAMTVTGPGTMHTIRKSADDKAADSKGRPIDVAWADSLAVDGTANTVDARGQVTVHVTDPDGTDSHMAGDSAHIDLTDEKKPADASALATNDQPSPSVVPEKSKHSASGIDAAGLGGKSPKLLTLDGKVHGESVLAGSDGAILRRGSLVGNRLIYDVASGRMEVPGAGQLGLEDHRAKNNGVAAPNNDSTPGGKGAMAVRWETFFKYDGQKQIVIQGNTRVGFQQDQKGAAPCNWIHRQ